MRLVSLTAALLTAATAAGAAPSEDDCRVERLPNAEAACLELVFESRFLRMQDSISKTLSSLQAATARELQSIGRAYETAQANWNDEVIARCRSDHAEDRVSYEFCRLDALYQREEDLELSLANAAEDLGAPDQFKAPTPQYVELLFPLPARLPFLGRARLPLLVPINPD